MKQSSETETNPEAQEGVEQIVAQQVVLAHVKGFDEQSRPVVSFIVAGQSFSFPAMATMHIPKESINRQVALSFIDGKIQQPLILGVVYSPLYEYLENIEISPSSDAVAQPDKHEELIKEPVFVDGKKVTIEGSETIELRCGEASITLTKAGKILIRGKYVLNRSSGVNRIVGGSVQVN